jgi:hypothetical protein
MGRFELGGWGLCFVALTGCSLIVENTLSDKPGSEPTADADLGEGTQDASSNGDAGSEPSGEGGTVSPSAKSDAGSVTGGTGADAGKPAGQGMSFIVAIGDMHGCALSPLGAVTCWGDDTEGQASMPDGKYSHLAAGAYHTCGIKTDGSLVCSGRNGRGQRAAAPGPFVEVAAGDAHTCARNAQGAVTCFGENAEGQATPPSGVRFSNISAGVAVSCGVRADTHELTCFGRGRMALMGEAVGKKLQTVSVGAGSACGIELNSGVVTCWGSIGPHEAYDAKATAISVATHACATFEDGRGACWGVDGDDWAVPNVDVGYVAIATGPSAYCTIPASGAGSCGPDSTKSAAKIPPNYPE